MHVKTINEYFYNIPVLQLYKYNLNILCFTYLFIVEILAAFVSLFYIRFAPKLNHIETNQQIPLYSQNNTDV